MAARGIAEPQGRPRRSTDVRIVTALLLALTAASCGVPAAPAASPPVPVPGPVVIDRASDGRTVRVRVDDIVEVRLGVDQEWQVRVADPTVLVMLQTFAPLPAGTQGAFRAARAGATVVEATGTAKCAPGQACPMYAILFRATVEVVP